MPDDLCCPVCNGTKKVFRVPDKDTDYYELTLLTRCPGCDGTGYRVPLGDFENALFDAIYVELQIAYLGMHDEEFDYHNGDVFDIPGIIWRPFYWGDDPYEAALPNFVAEGLDYHVEFRFYKRPGRGMTTNRLLELEDWHRWFEETLAIIRKAKTFYDNETF